MDLAHGSPTLSPTRIERLLADETATPEFVRELLWRMVDNANGAIQRAKRLFVIFLTCALLLELLHGGFLSEVSFLGAKLTNLALLGPLLVPAGAYVFLLCTSAFVSAKAFDETALAIVRARFPGLEHSRVSEMLRNADFIAVGDVPTDLLPKPLRRMDDVATLVQSVAFPLSGIAFWIYGCMRLFGGSTNVAYALVCVVLSLVAIVLAQAYFWTTGVSKGAWSD